MLASAASTSDGKRYADFNAKTDHVAEYGLAALVVGVAAKKLGLIALAVAFFAKFAKVILIGLALARRRIRQVLRQAQGGGAASAGRAAPQRQPEPTARPETLA